jgi:hypothetical protein
MVFAVQERIFIAESYISNQSYKATSEESEQKCSTEAFSMVASLF